MAARFWIGGSGNWSDTAHWSTTSGGAGGSAVPTSADDVTLDSNSGATATVTIDVAANANTVTINKSDITLLHNAGSTVVGAVTLTSGTLNTNGQTCVWGSYVGGTGTRTLTMGSSQITLTATTATSTGIHAFQPNTSAGFTITANTATITLSGNNSIFYSDSILSLNYNGLSVVFSGGGSGFGGGGGAPKIAYQGPITLANLTVTGTATATAQFGFEKIAGSSGSLTITGTLTLTGNSLSNRLYVQAFTPGTAETVTAAVVSLTNVDFADITANGAAVPWTGTSVGDCGGNTNITFTVNSGTSNGKGGVYRYAVVAGAWSNTATWSTASGGSGGASIPLPHDTAIFNANAAAGTYTGDMPRLCSDLDFTAFTRTFSQSVATTIYGSLTLASGMTATMGQTMVCAGRSSHTVTSAGKSPNYAFTILTPTGTYTCADNFSILGNNAFTLSAGTFDAATFSVTIGKFAYGGVLPATVKLGTQQWSLAFTTATTVWDASIAGLTVVSGSATIAITNTGSTTKTFKGGGLSYPTLTYTATGSGGLTITGSNTFTNLDLECTTARTVTLPASGTQTVTGTLTLKGASGQLLSIVSSAPGTATTIKLNSGATSVTSAFTNVSADCSVPILFDVASSSGYQASLSTYSWSHTCTGPKRGLLVNVSIFAAGTVTGITYNGVAMTFVRADTVGVYRNEVWRLENPASGANTIAVTLSASLTSIGSAVSYMGVNQTDMVEEHVGATGTGGTPTVSAPTVDDLSWVVGMISTANTAVSAGSGLTSRTVNSGALGSGALEDSGVVSPTATKTMAWSAVGVTDSWAVAATVLVPVGGAATYAVVLSGAVTPTGSVANRASKVFSGGVTPTGPLVKSAGKLLSGAATPTGGLVKLAGKLLTGGVTPTGGLVKAPAKTLLGTATPSGSLARLTGKSLSGTAGSTGTVSKTAAKLLTGLVAPIGQSVFAAITRPVRGVLSLSERSWWAVHISDEE